VYVFCLCLWAMLPELNEMMMMKNTEYINRTYRRIHSIA